MKPEILIELIKMKIDEQQALINYYLRGILVFIVIVGGTVKFALDKNATISLRYALSVIGVSTSILAFFTCLLLNHKRNQLDQEINMLHKEIESPLPRSNSTELKYCIFGTSIFTLVILLGFCYLFFI